MKSSASRPLTSWESTYESLLTTADEAVKCVKSGDTVFIGYASSVAYELAEALGRREDELENVTITCGMVTRPVRVLSDQTRPGAFFVKTWFMGAQERNLYRQGRADYTSFNLSEVYIFHTQTAPADVAFFEVSPPDEAGYCCFGASGVGMFDTIRHTAKTIILQVNQNAPYVYGEGNRIHISEAAAIVEKNDELLTTANVSVSEPIQKISDFLVNEIADGSCIQLGFGGLANAVGFGLREKNDLGIHTEMMTDSMMDLIKRGNVTNARKNLMPGLTLASFASGTTELYRFLNYNPDIRFYPFRYVNNPINIAKNDHVVSINNAVTVDLAGQVVADNIDGAQYTAVGGQIDFVRGAQLSQGGKSFIALESTAKKGTVSRIVAQLKPGTMVTTPRAEVQYVVTEYGCVNLKPLCASDRARAMISLAHPKFREGLLEQAKELHLL